MLDVEINLYMHNYQFEMSNYDFCVSRFGKEVTETENVAVYYLLITYLQSICKKYSVM